MLELFVVMSPIVVIVGTIWLAVEKIINRRNARRSLTWRSTSGRIVVSLLTAKGPKKRPVWVPNVEFKFDASGQTYTGSRIAYGLVFSQDEEEMRHIIDNYPVGAPVMVTYDPVDPSKSVLEPGIDKTKPLGIDLVMLFIIGVGLLLFNVLPLVPTI